MPPITPLQLIIDKCREKLDDIPPGCVAEKADANGEFDVCPEYLQSASECLNKLRLKGKSEKNWTEALPYYVVPYLRILQETNRELQKEEYDYSCATVMAFGLTKIFFTAIANADRTIITQTADALTAAMKTGKFKDVVEYVKKADISRIAPPKKGIDLQEMRDSLLLLLIVRAWLANDKMETGWEKNYIDAVMKYFIP